MKIYRPTDDAKPNAMEARGVSEVAGDARKREQSLELLGQILCQPSREEHENRGVLLSEPCRYNLSHARTHQPQRVAMHASRSERQYVLASLVLLEEPETQNLEHVVISDGLFVRKQVDSTLIGNSTAPRH